MSKESERIIQVNKFPNPIIGSYEINGVKKFLRMSDAMDIMGEQSAISALTKLKEQVEANHKEWPENSCPDAHESYNEVLKLISNLLTS